MVLRRVNKLLQNTVNENIQCTILEQRCGISLVEYITLDPICLWIGTHRVCRERIGILLFMALITTINL